jgi:hypothetical protein
MLLRATWLLQGRTMNIVCLMIVVGVLADQYGYAECSPRARQPMDTAV